MGKIIIRILDKLFGVIFLAVCLYKFDVNDRTDCVLLAVAIALTIHTFSGRHD